jgi:glyoxylase-like metal-dependent hydrolase (beta-lactamase superfamily II)/rhodanese-related sulfurtransferase
VLFQQFVDWDLGCASYLIGDEATGEALVVDPAYDIGPYMAGAERFETHIVRVLETHTHADHVSGHGRFALEHGLPVAIHSAAEPTYPYEALEEEEDVEVGAVTLRVLHTPGHRPEHCCFAVTDRSRADEPWLVLTGDSLFIGDAARPDLAVDAREGAEGLFESLRRLAGLGDGVELFPGHVAGSLCGAGMSSKASSTIGFERRFNPALAFSDLGAFVSERARISSPRPPNMDRIVELNRGPFLPAQPPVEPLASAAGATVLDVRGEQAFLDGHVPRAFNVPVSGTAFATKAGFLLDPSERIAIQASSPQEAEVAARSLRSVGFLELAGYLVDPPEATERTEPIRLEELEGLLADGAIQLLDVRDKDERDGGYIAGSRHLPYYRSRSCADEFRGGPTIATICETGARAVVAASALAHEGIEARPVIGGGVGDWQAEGRPLVSFRRCG